MATFYFGEPMANPSNIRLVLGLGNYPKKYQGTRHNIGFEVLDLIAKKLEAKVMPREKEYEWAVAQVGDREGEVDSRLRGNDKPERGKDDRMDSSFRWNEAEEERRNEPEESKPEASATPETPKPASSTHDSRLPAPDVLFAWPRTYMNLSGLAAKTILDKWSLTPEQMLVLVDDFALPLGSVRIRGKGSAGSHNGLLSIVEELGTERFPRIRLGIGQALTTPDFRPPIPEEAVDKPLEIIDFVLGKFDPSERPAVEKMVAHAAEAVIFALTHRLDETMSKFNLNVNPALPDSQ